MNIKRAMALAGLLGTGMLASAPAAALDLTCGGACPWVTYGDGNSFLLQYNAYIYDKLNGGGVGPGNPYYINSTPGAIKDLTVIGTGTRPQSRSSMSRLRRPERSPKRLSASCTAMMSR